MQTGAIFNEERGRALGEEGLALCNRIHRNPDILVLT
jgi:hypothetical protein